MAAFGGERVIGASVSSCCLHLHLHLRLTLHLTLHLPLLSCLLIGFLQVLVQQDGSHRLQPTLVLDDPSHGCSTLDTAGTKGVIPALVVVVGDVAILGFVVVALEVSSWSFFVGQNHLVQCLVAELPLVRLVVRANFCLVGECLVPGDVGHVASRNPVHDHPVHGEPHIRSKGFEFFGRIPRVVDVVLVSAPAAKDRTLVVSSSGSCSGSTSTSTSSIVGASYNVVEAVGAGKEISLLLFGLVALLIIIVKDVECGE
mmetsp:Transcript_32597/g.76808  ORF Transcript_32597/g.76808 Transcript_32597/m.76808 type:complete len:257 (-) Transcript_32597:842-1612(-)